MDLSRVAGYRWSANYPLWPSTVPAVGGLRSSSSWFLLLHDTSLIITGSRSPFPCQDRPVFEYDLLKVLINIGNDLAKKHHCMIDIALRDFEAFFRNIDHVQRLSGWRLSHGSAHHCAGPSSSPFNLRTGRFSIHASISDSSHAILPVAISRARGNLSSHIHVQIVG